MAVIEAEGLDSLSGWEANRAGGEPIDRAHLSRITFGDEGLQREVLQLFVRQSTMLVSRMDVARPAAVAALAHTLAGSALGLGAKPLGLLAAEVERKARLAPEELPSALAGLRASLEETSRVVLALLRGH